MNKLGIFMNFWENEWQADHIKYIKKTSDIGFDILEFQAQPLLDMSESRTLEIKNAAKEYGVELTYSLGLDKKYDISSCDEDVRLGGVKYLTEIMNRVHFMDGKIISGVSYAGWGVPDGNFTREQLLENSIKSMKELVKKAEEYGITYAVEAVTALRVLCLTLQSRQLNMLRLLTAKIWAFFLIHII